MQRIDWSWQACSGVASMMLLVLLSPSSLAAAFTVGVENLDYAPIYSNQNGRYTGYARDVLDAFAQKSGHQFKYVSLPVKRLSNEYLVRQSLDFKFPDNQYWVSAQREKLSIHYSSSLIDVIEGAMVLPQHKGSGLAHIKVLGTILGFTPRPYLDEIKRGEIQVYENSNFYGLIKQTLSARNDAAYVSIEVGRRILANWQMKDQLVFDPALPYIISEFKLSSIQHHEVIQQFNDFLQTETALINRIKLKYDLKNIDQY